MVDIVGELKDFGCKVDVYDPRVNQKEALDEYKISLIKKLDNKIYQGMIFAVAHEDFKVLKFEELKKANEELKAALGKEKEDGASLGGVGDGAAAGAALRLPLCR